VSGRRSTAASATSSTVTRSTPPIPCASRPGSASSPACTKHPRDRGSPDQPGRRDRAPCPACTSRRPNGLLDHRRAHCTAAGGRQDRLTAQPLPVSVALPERQFTLFFDDVRVSADRLIGTEGDGFRQVFHGLNPERVTGAALCVGIGRYALDKATRYANNRVVWDTPIGAYQGVSHVLAKAKIEVETAALMTAKAAWLHDHGQPAGEASNMAKYAAAEAALAAVDAAIQCHGGNGVSTSCGLIPLWGLARLLRIAPVNREMILNYVAQHSLGLPRSY
jgi:alkylation response protein AidB-like acyl-CoA dehydrogenase